MYTICLGQWSLGRFEDTFLHVHGHFNIPGPGFRLLTVKNFSSSVIKINPPMVKPFWFKKQNEILTTACLIFC